MLSSRTKKELVGFAKGSIALMVLSALITITFLVVYEVFYAVIAIIVSSEDTVTLTLSSVLPIIYGKGLHTTSLLRKRNGESENPPSNP